jgi:hypothetical protein
MGNNEETLEETQETPLLEVGDVTEQVTRIYMISPRDPDDEVQTKVFVIERTVDLTEEY